MQSPGLRVDDWRCRTVGGEEGPDPDPQPMLTGHCPPSSPQAAGCTPTSARPARGAVAQPPELFAALAQIRLLSQLVVLGLAVRTQHK
eukprot:8604514-Heterocapsa_arctica.AAC.1